MLTEQDKQAIEACTTHPQSVWSVIKEIAITKYDEYLSALQLTCTTSNRQSELMAISDRWSAVKDNLAKKEEFCSSEAFDRDLCYVLKAVAQRIHGLSTKFMNIEPYIRNWHNNRTMDRRTAFIISIGFGFNIEETRKLLYHVLDDDEQMDFNPRFPNEMIYAYSIINGIPITADFQKGDGKDLQQPSVEEMLYATKLQFLVKLFGSEDIIYFPRLITAADKSFNILDSLNMTKTALLLAAIKTSSDPEILLKSAAKERKEDTFQLEEDTVQTKRHPRLFPDDSVMQLCYEYAAYYVDNGDEVFRLADERKDTYRCYDPNIKPVFKNAQISRAHCIQGLNYVGKLLSTASNLVGNKSTEDNESGERKKELYSDMNLFIQECVDYIQQKYDQSLFSPIDFLPLVGRSKLGNYSQSELNTMIDTIIIKKIYADWLFPRDAREGDENGRSSSYHKKTPQIQGDHAKYFKFFFNALKVAFRDLRAVTAWGCQKIWAAFIEMNQILAFPYFSDDGVGMRNWEYDAEIEYHYTVDILESYQNRAETMPDPFAFIANLLSDIHCFEYFNHAVISRGKEKFVAELDDEGKLIGRTCNTQTGYMSLFLLQENDTFTQDEDLGIFYPYTRFEKQYYAKTTAFSRKDILKLAFWGFLGSRQHYNPKLDPADFTDYFDVNVARDTCCAVINESNSLDCFLLLCLEHEDPIRFLKIVIAFYKTLPKKESKDFWKMLR